MDNNRKSISFTGNLTIFKNYTSAKNTSKCYRVFHIEMGSNFCGFLRKSELYLDVFVVEHDELFDARLLAMTSP